MIHFAIELFVISLTFRVPRPWPPPPTFAAHATSYLVARPPLLDLVLRDLSQAIHMRGLARHGSLHYFNCPADDVLGHKRIRRREHLDADNANARIVLRTIMLSVAKVPEPRLERRVVMLLDEISVRHDRGLARDRRPLARHVEEGDVDVRVARQVVCLAGLGVCVEQEIDATRLSSGQSHASRD